jgi:hypothetical protein
MSLFVNRPTSYREVTIVIHHTVTMTPYRPGVAAICTRLDGPPPARESAVTRMWGQATDNFFCLDKQSCRTQDGAMFEVAVIGDSAAGGGRAGLGAGMAADRAAFAEEPVHAVTALVGEYHDETAEGGRPHQVVVAVHPVITEDAPKDGKDD